MFGSHEAPARGPARRPPAAGAGPGVVRVPGTGGGGDGVFLHLCELANPEGNLPHTYAREGRAGNTLAHWAPLLWALSGFQQL